MSLPFSREAFLAVFAQYNQGIWPAQALLLLLALFAVWAAGRGRPWSGRAVAAVLGLLWLWTGAVYHWTFFTALNPPAWAFGALVIAQGLAFLWVGAWRGRLEFRWRADAYGWTGAALIAYALAVYPALAVLFGHAYPAMPTFGAPCPTTIFTFGLLLWTPHLARWLLAIPFAWSVVGVSAALQLGVWEDIGLVVAGVIGTTMLLWRERRGHHGRGAALA